MPSFVFLVGSGSLVGTLKVCDGVGVKRVDEPVPPMLVSVPFSWKIPPRMVETESVELELDDDKLDVEEEDGVVVVVVVVGATLVVVVVVEDGEAEDVVVDEGAGGDDEADDLSSSFALELDPAELPSRLKTLILALEPFGTVTTQNLLPASPCAALPLMTAPYSVFEGLISQVPTHLPSHSTFMP